MLKVEMEQSNGLLFFIIMEQIKIYKSSQILQMEFNH